MKIKNQSWKFQLSVMTCTIAAISFPLAIVSCANNANPGIQAKTNLNAAQFNFNGLVKDYQNQIDAKWIFENKNVLFDGDLKDFTSAQQIEKVLVNSGGFNNDVMVIKATFVASLNPDQNFNPTPVNNHLILINGFTKENVDTPLLKRNYPQVNLQAQDLELNGKPLNEYEAQELQQNANLITNQWVFANKDKLFAEQLPFLNSEQEINFLRDKISLSADRSILRINLQLSPATIVEHDYVPNSKATIVRIPIFGFRPINSNQNPPPLKETIVREFVGARSVGLRGTVEQNLPLIDKNWVFNFKSFLFGGSTHLFTDVQQIENLIVERSNSKVIRISIKLAANTYVDWKNAVANKAGDFFVHIGGFIGEEPKVQRPSEPPFPVEED